MQKITELSNGMIMAEQELEYQAAHEVFQKIYHSHDYHFLLESKQVSLFSGRFSLIGVDAVLKLSGKDERFEIKTLNERGQQYLAKLQDSDLDYCDELERTAEGIEGRVEKDQTSIEQSQRSKRKNIAQVIRSFIQANKVEERVLLGLYGAFAYDFVRLFEDLGDKLPETETNDFNLFLYDSFILFDHIKQKTIVTCFRTQEEEAKQAARQLADQASSGSAKEPTYQITDADFALDQKTFEEMVFTAREQICQGEIFQVVLSNILKASFSGDPFALYLKYRVMNPSPYLFYYEFGNEQLVGASPEMMVRCEEGIVHLRPIAGTARRGTDPFEDHENMLKLLNDPKERAELDMLVDLGRNDLSRICENKIEVSDYRFVEKYSRVMHTVAHLSGKLKEEYDGVDALFSCLNHGTLTGAPKVAAMRIIEKLEQERRGYYGGAMGQLTFSGDVDTGIFIRSAHIQDGKLRYQSGAGIVYDSDPHREYVETMNKAQAFLDTFSPEQDV